MLDVKECPCPSPDIGYALRLDGTTIHRYTPVQVIELDSVSSITTGGRHSLAVKSDGTVWAWGWNAYGQLGDGTHRDRFTPIQVASPEAPQWPVYDAMTVTDGLSLIVGIKWG